MIEEWLYAQLTSSSAVSAIVAARVYPTALPQESAMPAIVYSRQSTERPRALDGGIGLVHVTMRLDCWADAYADAHELAEAVREELDWYAGASIQLVTVDDEEDGWDRELGLARVTLQVSVWHQV